MTTNAYARSRGFILPFAVLTILAINLVAATVPALAEPEASEPDATQEEVDRLKSEIAAINQSAELSVERYNQANTELEGTRQRLAQNETALKEASAKLADAQIRLEKRLANIYRDGSLSILDVMLNTNSFSEFMTRFDMLGRIGEQDRSDIEEVLKYKSDVEKVQQDLDSARQQQEELLTTLAAEKSEVESKLAARQTILSEAEGDVARLLSEQTQQQAGAAEAASETGGEPPADPGPAPDPGGDYSAPPPAYGDAVSIASQYLGVPYVWGGASPSGFDCSGLVLYVYAQLGIYLPHSAAAQFYSGTPVSDAELAPGDLVFFGSPISHVGIYAGGGSMIHAPFEGAVVSYGGIGGHVAACRL